MDIQSAGIQLHMKLVVLKLLFEETSFIHVNE
jgi:hypothetical protein